MSTAVTSAGRDAAGADWVSCPGCRGLVYGSRLRRLLGVCPECGWHRPVGAGQRLDQLLDPGSRRAVDVVTRSDDPLGFVDDRPYPERLEAARAATGLDEGAVCARGTVDGNPVVVVAMDFRFMGGSLGRAVGEIVTVAAETALAERTPLLIVTASGGARMQEGALALMQMAKTTQALGQLDDAGILSVALVTDPTYGGVAASFATVCDVIVAEPGARLGFAGRRVVEQTIRQELPAGFQTAEFLLEHGVVDAVVPRSRLRAVLAPLLSIGARREVPAPAGVPAVRGAIVRDADTLDDGDAWDLVRAARDLGRPTTTDYLAAAFDEFLELRGDRMAADSRAVVGGLARVDGVPVVVIGQQKGHDAAALRETNYGMSGPEGYRKAARLMRLAAKLGLPVVTLVDTPGAYPGIDAEEHGQAVAIAESIRLMAGLPVPVVTVVTGEGGSGGALALGVANEVLVLSGAVYSVITPEGCAAILWKDPAAAPAAAAALGLSPARLLRHGVVDGVVPEPAGGAAADPAGAAERLRGALLDALTPLLRLDAAELVARRRARFRAFGAAGTRSLTPEGRADR